MKTTTEFGSVSCQMSNLMQINTSNQHNIIQSDRQNSLF
jgi:hypothetical protein